MSLHCALRLDRGGFVLDVDFTTPAAGVTALFGPTGSGKTTVLRCVAGLERGARGTVRFAGDAWQDDRAFVPPHRRGVGYVFQDAALFPHLDVRGNVEYGHRRSRGPAPDAATVLRLLDLDPLLDRRVDGLSGGERQRVAIARAVLAGPRLLLMDEPLASLDHGARRRILPYLESLTRELDLPVLYVSHALEEVARLADRIVLMEAGRIVAAGEAAELLTRLDLPPAREPDAAAVVAGRVVGYDGEDGLVEVESPGGRFLVPARGRAVGEPVRLRILARDVSLALARPRDTSILNILPARVVELDDLGPARCVVRLEAGGVPLLALLTRRSARHLELRPGLELFAQVKSAAVLD